MPSPYSVIRIVMSGVCLILTACATITQPSAVVARTSPDPAPIFNFQIVSKGGTDGSDAIYRSGQPKKTDWAYLNEIGVRTVVKLNQYSLDAKEGSEEEVGLAKRHNINVIPLYMQPEDAPYNLNPWASPNEKALMDAVAALEDKKNWPVLVHCSHGKDRTGLVVAVYSMRNKNLCREAAYKQMKYYGTSPVLFGLKPILDNIKENDNCTKEWIAQ